MNYYQICIDRYIFKTAETDIKLVIFSHMKLHLNNHSVGKEFETPLLWLVLLTNSTIDQISYNKLPSDEWF